MGKQINIGGDIYEIPSNQATAITNYLVYAWEKLGKPEDPLSESGKKLMDVLLATWEDTYPTESYSWRKAREEHISSELSLKEQIDTGRSLASYPTYVFYLMKKLFPNWDPIKRENCIALIREFPIFRMVEKI